MNQFTVSLSDVEVRALSYVALDPAEWIQNAASERARLAIIEMANTEIERMMSDPEISEIPASHEEIVMASQLPSALERQEVSEKRHQSPPDAP